MRRDWKYEIRRRREKALLAVVWRLPRSWVYWAVIRAATKPPEGNNYPAERRVVDVLDAWGYR